MKKVYVLLLAMLLILTGCAEMEKTKDIRVTDAVCPYSIHYNRGVLEVTLQNNTGNPLQWQVQVLPDDVCKVTEVPQTKENTISYTVEGLVPGAAQLIFTAVNENGTAAFVVDMIVDVSSANKVTVRECEHQESKYVAEESNGLSYEWSVDVDGVLNFTFTDLEHSWLVNKTESTVFSFTKRLSTPSGCNFSVRALNPGQDTVVLVSDDAQRTVHVVVQVDEAGNLEVVSVQEQ